MTKPYPKEFRDDVVRVALNREPGVELAQIAKDFGVHFTTLYGWMKKAEVEAGTVRGSRVSRPRNSRPQTWVEFSCWAKGMPLGGQGRRPGGVPERVEPVTVRDRAIL
jgi:transposase-like protein